MTNFATLPAPFVTRQTIGRGERSKTVPDRRKIHAADYGRETHVPGERQQPLLAPAFVRHRVLKIHIQFAVRDRVHRPVWRRRW